CQSLFHFGRRRGLQRVSQNPAGVLAEHDELLGGALANLEGIVIQLTNQLKRLLFVVGSLRGLDFVLEEGDRMLGSGSKREHGIVGLRYVLAAYVGPKVVELLL